MENSVLAQSTPDRYPRVASPIHTILMLVALSGLALGVGRGEFAVMVHDDYQSRGLGFKLTDTVIGIAQEKGLREINGYIDANNRRMLRVVAELGFVAEETVDCVTTVRLSPLARRSLFSEKP